MEEGVNGLPRDKMRKPGKPPLPTATVQKVIDMVTGPPPGETSHWTGRMLATAVGISFLARCRARVLAKNIRPSSYLANPVEQEPTSAGG